MNTARTAEIMVDADDLNRMPLGDVLRATEAARVVADGVCSGPVRNALGEQYWLVRIEGRIAAIGKTEVEALEASETMVLRYLARRAGIRARWEAEEIRRAERASAKAACPGHEYVGREVGRCLTYYACKNCGCGETVDSSD